MNISQAQINAAIIKAMGELPNLDKPSPFYQIGYSCHGIELSFKDPAGGNEFVKVLAMDKNTGFIEQSSNCLHIRFGIKRPSNVPSHVSDYTVQEFMGEIIARAMSLKYNIELVSWHVVAFNAPSGVKFVA